MQAQKIALQMHMLILLQGRLLADCSERVKKGRPASRPFFFDLVNALLHQQQLLH